MQNAKSIAKHLCPITPLAPPPFSSFVYSQYVYLASSRYGSPSVPCLACCYVEEVCRSFSSRSVSQTGERRHHQPRRRGRFLSMRGYFSTYPKTSPIQMCNSVNCNTAHLHSTIVFTSPKPYSIELSFSHSNGTHFVVRTTMKSTPDLPHCPAKVSSRLILSKPVAQCGRPCYLSLRVIKGGSLDVGYISPTFPVSRSLRQLEEPTKVVIDYGGIDSAARQLSFISRISPIRHTREIILVPHDRSYLFIPTQDG
ncbi:hypothetical protein F5Y18DRAFT_116961 [Xylariaceae sp. FL1019]|nr:hypothetical protein F5Y18DRAFT_116961 [Xylariaceae sp. FL1019]